MRTPYGDIAWDGDENFPSTVISGIGWGDRYKFKTTSAPLTRNSSWDYSEPNLVPYVHAWADASDTEMGVVQTQTYLQKDAGGYWFYKNWGKTSENQDPDDGQVGKMPLSWNWPYQMNQYELCYPEAESCVDQPDELASPRVERQLRRRGWGRRVRHVPRLRRRQAALGLPLRELCRHHGDGQAHRGDGDEPGERDRDRPEDLAQRDHGQRRDRTPPRASHAPTSPRSAPRATTRGVLDLERQRRSKQGPRSRSRCRKARSGTPCWWSRTTPAPRFPA